MNEATMAALRNPVGRAIAIRSIRSAMSTSLLKLAYLSHGDRCWQQVSEVGDMMSIIGSASDRDPGIRDDDPRCRIVAGAVSACSNMMELDRFDRNQLQAIEMGVKAAVELAMEIRPSTLVESILWFQSRTGCGVDVTLRRSR